VAQETAVGGRDLRGHVAGTLVKAVQMVCWRYALDENDVHKAWYRISRAGVNTKYFAAYVSSRRLERFRCHTTARLYTRVPGGGVKRGGRPNMCRWTEADYTQELHNADLPLDRDGNVPDRIAVLVFPRTHRKYQEGYFTAYPYYNMYVDGGYERTAGDSAGVAEGTARPGKRGAMTGRRR
jgi:hypothetical protein